MTRIRPTFPLAMRRRLLAGVLAAGLLPFCTMPASAAGGYPDRPVRIVVPSVPGGLMDTSARLVAAKLSGYWGVPVIVENRPGAGMAIGTQEVARSPADGYTLLLTYEGAVVTNPLLVETVRYSLSDFVPLAQVWDTSLVLVVNRDVPATTVAELDAHIRRHPGELNYAVTDITTELMSDMVKQAAGWDYATITYKGNGDRLRSIMAGETQMTLLSATDAISATGSGRVRALGISALERSPALPDIPTLHESGIKDFTLQSWGGLFARAGTPEAILDKLRTDSRRALAEPDVVEKIESGGTLVGTVSSEAFAQRVRDDRQRWRELAERRGMPIYDN